MVSQDKGHHLGFTLDKEDLPKASLLHRAMVSLGRATPLLDRSLGLATPTKAFLTNPFLHLVACPGGHLVWDRGRLVKIRASALSQALVQLGARHSSLAIVLVGFQRPMMASNSKHKSKMVMIKRERTFRMEPLIHSYKTPHHLFSQ
jgi:hypothetical protein